MYQPMNHMNVLLADLAFRRSANVLRIRKQLANRPVWLRKDGKMQKIMENWQKQDEEKIVEHANSIIDKLERMCDDEVRKNRNVLAGDIAPG